MRNVCPTFPISDACYPPWRLMTKISIGSKISEKRKITHGVPQGSILGPILFNVYINDLPMAPEAGSLKSFVDDSKLFLSFSINEANSVVNKLNKDLQRVVAWCSLNSLLINPN